MPISASRTCIVYTFLLASSAIGEDKKCDACQARGLNPCFFRLQLSSLAQVNNLLFFFSFDSACMREFGFFCLNNRMLCNPFLLSFFGYTFRSYRALQCFTACKSFETLFLQTAFQAVNFSYFLQ